MEALPGFTALKVAGGEYASPPVRLSAATRAFPGIAFYRRAALIVWRSAQLAKRGGYDDAAWAASSLAILRALEAAGVRIRAAGIERFAALAGPCVFIGNHMSTCETFLLPAIVRPYRPLTFIVKRQLVNYPVFGHVMRSRDPILVGRENPREDLKAVLEGGVRRLQAGISIAVFPQTTRTPRFDPAAFNSIGIKLAKRAQVPVVPIALKTDAWGNGWPVKDVGKIDPAREVRFAFGEPLRVQGAGAAEHQQVVDFIRANLLAWGGTVAEVKPYAGG